MPYLPLKKLVSSLKERPDRHIFSSATRCSFRDRLPKSQIQQSLKNEFDSDALVNDLEFKNGRTEERVLGERPGVGFGNSQLKTPMQKKMRYLDILQNDVDLETFVNDLQFEEEERNAREHRGRRLIPVSETGHILKKKQHQDAICKLPFGVSRGTQLQRRLLKHCER